VGGFWWLLRGMPDLPSNEGGVLCGGGLLVEKINSVDLVVVGFFFNQNSRFFFCTVNSEQFFFRSN
jgi:hypothetical protein